MSAEMAMKHLKIVIGKHALGYVAYPGGVKSAVVGEGHTFDEALRDKRTVRPSSTLKMDKPNNAVKLDAIFVRCAHYKCAGYGWRWASCSARIVT
jgi:hypothetical protein